MAPLPLDPQPLLPPLLACLPTAFASPKPPPALLPLLSPILSQRVQLLSESTERSSWLPLLNWDNREAGRLASIIENADLEPHPVSGDVEVGDPEPVRYRKLDEETLQGLVNLPDVGLAVVYVWSTAEGKEAWRVAEVKPVYGSWLSNPMPWETSISQAEEVFKSKALSQKSLEHNLTENKRRVEDEDGDDDDYWGRYDATPGRTPAKQSPAPQQHMSQAVPSATVEDSYWNQYGQVQPAMDGEDPDEEAANAEHMGDSGLSGSTLFRSVLAARQESATEAGTMHFDASVPEGVKGDDKSKSSPAPQRSLYTPNGTSTILSNGSASMPKSIATETRPLTDKSHEHIQHPRPQSAQSTGSSQGSSRIVENLEEQAKRSSSPADFAIQQHISTSMKSLYRLSKGAGMEKAEFKRIVKAELGVLSLIDED